MYAHDVLPALPWRNNEADSARLRVDAATVATAGDVLNRYWANYSGSGAGLRGGAFHIRRRSDGYDFTLDGISYATDLTITGTLHWNQVDGMVTGEVDLAGARDKGYLAFAWPERLAGAHAAISGSIDGKRVSAVCPAP